MKRLMLGFVVGLSLGWATNLTAAGGWYSARNLVDFDTRPNDRSRVIGYVAGVSDTVTFLHEFLIPADLVTKVAEQCLAEYQRTPLGDLVAAALHAWRETPAQEGISGAKALLLSPLAACGAR
jgi:hypothetical protein